MIKRKDLVDIGDADYDTRRNEFMQCLDCGEEMSGTRGDFFSLPMDWVFSCPAYNSERIAIVKKVCKIVVIRDNAN